MIYIKYIREHSKLVKEAIRNKNEKADVDRLLYLDSEKRKQLARVEDLKHPRNVVSKKIGDMKKSEQDANSITLEMTKVSAEIKKVNRHISTL